jgi:hypothetical protein
MIGFHIFFLRYTLSNKTSPVTVIMAPRKEVLARYNGKLDCVMSKITPPYSKLSTKAQIIAPNKVTPNNLPFDLLNVINKKIAILIDITITLSKKYDILFFNNYIYLKSPEKTF